MPLSFLYVGPPYAFITRSISFCIATSTLSKLPVVFQVFVRGIPKRFCFAFHDFADTISQRHFVFIHPCHYLPCQSLLKFCSHPPPLLQASSCRILSVVKPALLSETAHQPKFVRSQFLQRLFATPGMRLYNCLDHSLVCWF